MYEEVDDTRPVLTVVASVERDSLAHSSGLAKVRKFLTDMYAYTSVLCNVPSPIMGCTPCV